MAYLSCTRAARLSQIDSPSRDVKTKQSPGVGKTVPGGCQPRATFGRVQTLTHLEIHEHGYDQKHTYYRGGQVRMTIVRSNKVRGEKNICRDLKKNGK